MSGIFYKGILYGAGGSGGGGTVEGESRTLTSLWTNSGSTNPSTVTLSDAYSNYDDFICVCYRSANNTYEPEFYTFISDRMTIGCNFACLAWSGSGDYVTFTLTNATTFTLYNQGSHLVLHEVIGVKYYFRGSGGGGSSTLSGLTDVNLTNPTNGQVLIYNSTTQKWENGSGGSGGGGSFTESIIFTGSKQTTSGEITLSSNLSNFDQINVYTGWTSSSTNGCASFILDSAYLIDHCPYDSGSTAQSSAHVVINPYDTEYIRIKCGSAGNKLFLFDAHNVCIEKIIGLKYGSGGSGGSSVIANPSGMATATLTKIEIDGVIYDLGGSGGSGQQMLLSENLASNNSNTLSTNETITSEVVT